MVAAKRKPSRWSSSKFGKLVEGAGLVLGGDDQENLLSKLNLLSNREYNLPSMLWYAL